MESKTIATRLLEERESLRLVSQALRRRLFESGSAGAAQNSHLPFLLDILKRHAARVFKLAAQRDCLDFAVEWQESVAGVAERCELIKKELELLMADAEHVSPSSPPEDICDFLDRLGLFLDREQQLSVNASDAAV